MRIALMKTPSAPQRISSWTGDTAAFNVVAHRLHTFEEWWDKSAQMDARRMFLVLCAYDHEDINRANWAAYHGGEDDGI